MSTNQFDTDTNNASVPNGAGTPAGMHQPTHGQQDAIEICNTDDLRREKALRESALRVPR